MSFVNTTVLFVAVFCAVRPAIATDYAIRFDYGVDHPDASDGPELKAKMFNWFKWRSVGWKKGGLFQNTSGQEIKAVHIKVTHPRTAQNPTGDLLAIASDPEDGVFDTIYLKDDYTEVIFSSSKGAVANGQTLWNKVTKSTTGEITACRNNGEDICPLEGKLFSTPQEPSEGKWTKIKSPGNEAELWKPIAALPRRFRQIDVYGVSNDEKFVVFASRNRVLAFSTQADRAFYIDAEALEPEGINRITFENGQFVLYRSGVAGSKFTPGEWKVTEIKADD